MQATDVVLTFANGSEALVDSFQRRHRHYPPQLVPSGVTHTWQHRLSKPSAGYDEMLVAKMPYNF